MNSDIEDVRQAVESLHNCKASYIVDEAVIENFGDEMVWKGFVHIFKLEGHPKAKGCYAWSSPIEGSTKKRYYAVLNIPPVDSAEKAVRASIVQDHKAGKL